MKNRLKGLRVYLAGPMDEVADLGRDWRDDISLFLWNYSCGVLNPTDKAIDAGVEDEELHRRVNILRADAAKETNQARLDYLYGEIEKLFNPVVAVDLAMVDRADFVILYVDKDVHMCGSYAEESLAVMLKKPVIVCCKQGKHKIPGFLFKRKGRHKMMFSDWTGVKDYLHSVALNPNFKDETGTWKFFEYDKVYRNL